MTSRAITTLFLTDADIDGLLSVEEAISVVEQVLRQQATGDAANRPRGHDYASPGAYQAWMQAAAYGLGVCGFKTYTIVGGSGRFFVYVYDVDGGPPLSIMEANRLGQLRTGAASGVAARHMANEDASVIALLGSGLQAASQLEAFCAVRPIELVRVHSPTPRNRAALAERMTAKLGIAVEAVDSPEPAVREADVVATITTSTTPVFRGEWLREGTHVSAAGGAHPYATELDEATIARADAVVVDDPDQARIECGEFMMASASGALLWERVRELCHVVSGRVPGRTSDRDVTLFKSLGMALWDVAAAKAVYDRAIERGVGTRL